MLRAVGTAIALLGLAGIAGWLWQGRLPEVGFALAVTIVGVELRYQAIKEEQDRERDRDGRSGDRRAD